MARDYGDVLSAFGAVPTGGSFWKARCPVGRCAEKRRPTLRFWIAGNGNLMVCCWRHGRMHGQERIEFMRQLCRAAGVSVMDFFEERQEQPDYRDAPRRRVAHVFTYEDQDGRPSHRTLRYEPKNFAQERWDEERGRWMPGLGPYPEMPRYLYRLPQINGCPDRQVVLVEGELKVHLLESWGFLATCNVGGQGMGWLDSYSQWLAGRDVVVMPDNDAPGQRHADSAVGSLIRHGASSLRLVVLPGLPPKGDVVDWAKAGHAAEDLRRVIDATPAWRPR
jgi:hypothetical protein